MLLGPWSTASVAPMPNRFLAPATVNGKWRRAPCPPVDDRGLGAGRSGVGGAGRAEAAYRHRCGRLGSVSDSPVIGQVLQDGFSRVREGVSDVLHGIEGSALTWRPDPAANSIAWLIWHLTRVQDDHLAAAFGCPQVWMAAGWADRFALPFPPEAHGYGMTAADVGRVDVARELLQGYFDAVATQTEALVSTIAAGDLERVVDDRWDPPVTLGVRLISVIADDLQHVGQAAYVRGLAERR